MPIFHISTPVADWTREQIEALKEFMCERGIAENTVRENAEGPYLYSILSDETRTLDQVRDWLINESLERFPRPLGFVIKGADEFVFTWEPKGPGHGRLACLVLAPDEKTATEIMLRAANGIAFEQRTLGEVLWNVGLLEKLRKKTPLGIGPLVDKGLKLPALQPCDWPPRLEPL